MRADLGFRTFDNAACSQRTIPMAALNHPEASGRLQARIPASTGPLPWPTPIVDPDQLPGIPVATTDYSTVELRVRMTSARAGTPRFPPTAQPPPPRPGQLLLPGRHQGRALLVLPGAQRRSRCGRINIGCQEPTSVVRQHQAGGTFTTFAGPAWAGQAPPRGALRTLRHRTTFASSARSTPPMAAATDSPVSRRSSSAAVYASPCGLGIRNLGAWNSQPVLESYSGGSCTRRYTNRVSPCNLTR